VEIEPYLLAASAVTVIWSLTGCEDFGVEITANILSSDDDFVLSSDILLPSAEAAVNRMHSSSKTISRN